MYHRLCIIFFFYLQTLMDYSTAISAQCKVVFPARFLMSLCVMAKSLCVIAGIFYKFF